MSIEIIEDSKGNEVVVITNDDGTTVSMTKDYYDELEAAKAIGADEAKTK